MSVAEEQQRIWARSLPLDVDQADVVLEGSRTVVKSVSMMEAVFGGDGRLGDTGADVLTGETESGSLFYGIKMEDQLLVGILVLSSKPLEDEECQEVTDRVSGFLKLLTNRLRRALDANTDKRSSVAQNFDPILQSMTGTSRNLRLGDIITNSPP